MDCLDLLLKLKIIGLVDEEFLFLVLGDDDIHLLRVEPPIT